MSAGVLLVSIQVNHGQLVARHPQLYLDQKISAHLVHCFTREVQHLLVLFKPSPVENIRVSLVEHSQRLVLYARFYFQVRLRPYPKLHLSNDLAILHPAQLQQFDPPVFLRINNQIAAICLLNLIFVLIKTEVFFPQVVVLVKKVGLNLILFALKNQHRRVTLALDFSKKASIRILEWQHKLGGINFHVAQLEHLDEAVLVYKDQMLVGVKKSNHLFISFPDLAVNSWTSNRINHYRPRRKQTSEVYFGHNSHHFFLTSLFLYALDVLIQNFE